MGDDNMVVDAARVSFDKAAENYTATQNEKLIRYLRRHNHWSPFSHCMVQFRVTAPIFVARQLFKHQIGLALNEISRRYVDEEPDFDCPTEWRKRHSNKKQGSAEALPQIKQDLINLRIRNHLEESKRLYKYLIELEVAPEQARAILPLCTNTSWIWTGSLEAWLRVCSLRIADDAQLETRYVAEQISDNIQKLFPISWKASNQQET